MSSEEVIIFFFKDLRIGLLCIFLKEAHLSYCNRDFYDRLPPTIYESENITSICVL